MPRGLDHHRRRRVDSGRNDAGCRSSDDGFRLFPEVCATGLLGSLALREAPTRTALRPGSTRLLTAPVRRCSCHICHDVAPNLQKMYKKYRYRGLQIIGMHSTPKGYKAKDKDVAALKEWVDEAGLEFSIVDTHVSRDTAGPPGLTRAPCAKRPSPQRPTDAVL